MSKTKKKIFARRTQCFTKVHSKTIKTAGYLDYCKNQIIYENCPISMKFTHCAVYTDPIPFIS